MAAALGADGRALVLFCGAGATGAIDKVVAILGLRIPSPLEDQYQLSDHIPPADRPGFGMRAAAQRARASMSLARWN